MLALILVFGSPADGAVRLRPRAQLGDRHRPGAERQAEARPARGAQRAGGPRRARRPDARRSTSQAVVLDDLVELRTGDQIADRRVVVESRPGWRSTSRCSPARPIRSTSTPDDDGRSPGSFVVAGAGRFQATAVGADSYAAQARQGGPAVPAHALRARGGHQHDPAHTSRGSDPGRGAAPVLAPAPATASVDAGDHARRSPASSAMVPEGLVLLTASRSAWRRSPSPGARCWCRSCRRSRGWRGSTSCASTRPARSPRARSCSTSSSRSTRRRGRRGRRRGARRAAPTTRTATRTARALAAEFTDRRAGRAPAACRSRRRASGARRRSTATGPG